MNETNASSAWIDALAGVISPIGRDCEYMVRACTQWAQSQWRGERSASGNTSSDLAKSLRVLTGYTEQEIAICATAASRETLLQQAWVLSRARHQLIRHAESSSDVLNSGSRCLAAVGSDHGSGIVGRMASGRADTRSSEWPLVPGFNHAPLETLAQQIDESTAMVLISPINIHDRMLAISRGQLVAISDACQRHGACLVIDHSQIPPHGGGHFWMHEAIAKVTADAVIMSAGLTGGHEGGLLALGESLAKHITAVDSRIASDSSHACIAALASATLDQWIAHSWVSVELTEFPTELAGRLANRDCVRDLHVTGRTIAIELDIPAAHWVKIASDHQLGVASAGDFAVALQLPLILRPESIAELCERIDQIFDWIELEEREAAATPPQGELHESAGFELTKPAPDESPQETAGDSGYDVSETDSLEDELDEQSYREDENHSPAMPADPEIQS